MSLTITPTEAEWLVDVLAAAAARAAGRENGQASTREILDLAHIYRDPTDLRALLERIVEHAFTGPGWGGGPDREHARDMIRSRFVTPPSEADVDRVVDYMAATGKLGASLTGARWATGDEAIERLRTG